MRTTLHSILELLLADAMRAIFRLKSTLHSILELLLDIQTLQSCHKDFPLHSILELLLADDSLGLRNYMHFTFHSGTIISKSSSGIL